MDESPAVETMNHKVDILDILPSVLDLPSLPEQERDPIAEPAHKFGYHRRFKERIGIWVCHSAVPDWPAFKSWKTRPLAEFSFLQTAALDLMRLITEWQPNMPTDWTIATPPQGASTRKTDGGLYPAAILAEMIADRMRLNLCRELLARGDSKPRHSAMLSLQQCAYTIKSKPPSVVIIVDDLITTGTTAHLSMQACASANIPAFFFAWSLGVRKP